MKKPFYILVLILLSLSCKEESKKDQKTDSFTDQKETTELTEQKLNPNKQGIKELKSFENKYERKWKIQPKEFPYSDGDIIKVYKLDCTGECFKSEFKNRVSEGIEISKNDFEELVGVLKDPESYNNSTAACFDPQFGLVVYDNEEVPTEFMSICMSCNDFRTYPGKINIQYENERLFGFSSSTRKKLREMFFKWGIDYYGYSSFWDDEEEYQSHLNNK